MGGPIAVGLALAEDLFSSYRQDHASGILDARMRWRDLDEELFDIVRGWMLSAQRELEEVESVTALGIDGYEWAFFVEAQNTVSFHRVLEVVREHEGDPPASKALKDHALDILSGRMNLPGAVRLVAADASLLSAFPYVFQTFLPGVDPEQYSALSQAVRVAAAAALPRDELLRLRGVSEAKESQTAEQDPYDEVRREYQRIMQELAEEEVVQDPRHQEELLLKALDLAAQSPEPDDDIETIGNILALGDRFSLSAYSVQRCVDAVHMLATRGHSGPDLAQALVSLAPLVAAHDLKDDLGGVLVEAAQALFKTPLTQQLRYTLATTAARALLWQKRTNEADAFLRDALGTDPDPISQIGIGMLKADVCLVEDNRHMATAVLLETLDKTRTLDGRNRLPALKKLFGVWPKGRNTRELRPFVREIAATAERLTEPKRTLTLVTSLLRLVGLGDRQAAMELWRHVDYERLRYSVPKSVAQRMFDVVEKAARTLDVPLSVNFDDETAVTKVRQTLVRKTVKTPEDQ